MKVSQYNYNATVVKIYDGDTITVDIDLGFGIKYTNVKLRLYGINTPEIRGEQRSEGLISKEYVVSKLLNQNIIISTIKDKTGKYGRYLAVVFYKDGENWINLNDELIANGLAEVY